MFFKRERIKSIGEILAGLGLLFFGLSTMSKTINNNADIIQGVQAFFGAKWMVLLL